MPRRGQQPALVHGAVHGGLPGRRHPGLGDGSAGGLAASGQRVGCHQELDLKTDRVTCVCSKLLSGFVLMLLTGWGGGGNKWLCLGHKIKFYTHILRRVKIYIPSGNKDVFLFCFAGLRRSDVFESCIGGENFICVGNN